MGDKRLEHDILYRATRIKRGVRILKYGLYPTCQVLSINGGNRITKDLSLTARRRNQSQHHSDERGFAASGFADKAE